MHEARPLLRTRNLSCYFGTGHNITRAVENISLSLAPGSITSLVGQSGSGKTTLGRMLLGLQRATKGEILLDESPVQQTLEYWKKVQGVFQDPFSAFNQFFVINRQLRNCRKIMGRLSLKSLDQRIDSALRQVNLNPDLIRPKYPFELSGGQMQRLLLARIFLIRPKLLIADEPTSMVDACSRGSILNELFKLKQLYGMTILFITHDLGMARHISDRILIMQGGKIVEDGAAESVTGRPQHPYTRQLLADIPTFNKGWLKVKPEKKPNGNAVIRYQNEPKMGNKPQI